MLLRKQRNNMAIDKIQTASMESGVPSKAQMPSGSVLQVQVVQWSTPSTRTGTLQNYVDLPDGFKAITTSVANSKILVQIQVQIYNDNVACAANLGLRRDTTRLAGIDGATGNGWSGHGNGYAGAQRMCLDYFDSPNAAAGTTLVYAALHGHWTGAGSSFINYSSTYTNYSTMILTEIAP